MSTEWPPKESGSEQSRLQAMKDREQVRISNIVRDMIECGLLSPNEVRYVVNETCDSYEYQD